MFSSKIARWGGLVIVLLVLGGVLMNSSYLLKKNNNKNIVIDSTKNTKATTTTTTTPKPDIIEDTVEISRVELEELKISAQSCKVLKHFSIVLIDTGGEVHKQIRQLVGSIHRYHEYELLIYIYGLDLDEAAKGEIHIWRNVEYWDIRSIYQVSTNIDRTEKINAEYWKPVIFKHSVERLGKFVYIQPGFYLSKKLEVDAIDEYLERHGSFYASPACKDNLSSEKYMAIASTFDVAMHGIQFNSYAYKNIYTPLYDCARAHCSPAQMKDLDTDKFISLSDDLKLSVFCQDIEKITTSLVSSPPAESGCYIINREDFILSGTQLPGSPQKSWLAFTPTKDDSGLIKQPDDKRIHIALGIPTTSKGHSQVSENPVLRVLLPSLKNTIAKKGTEEGDKYVYKLYLAIDRGDPVYDKPENQKHFKELVTNMMSEYNFHFQIIRVINSYGWVPMLWNTVFHHSIDDGADYFYQLNDDVGFITPGWTQILIDRLVKNPVRSNFGVTGPTDEGNRSIFTQAFVHRTHHKIFGYFYPYVFKNWYSDDWVSLVYRDNNSYFKDPNQPLVRNQQTFGTRYDVCSANGKENLNKVLQSSKIKIKEYLESHKD